MLGKLLKYEFMATSRVFFPFYALVLALGMVSGLLSEFGGGFYSKLTLGLTILALVVIYFMTFAVSISRFNKNLLGKEGYLSFTLPVSATNHILSKLLIALFWNFLSLITVALTLAITVRFEGVFNAIKNAYDAILNIEGGVSMFFTTILSMFTAMVNFLMMVYASLAISSSIKLVKNRILGGVIIYFVLSFISGILYNLVAMRLFGGMVGEVNELEHVMPFGSLANFMGQLNQSMLVSIGMTTLMIVVYFFLTRYFLRNKLNLTD